MKTFILFLITFFSLIKLSFSQCDVNVLGNDFAWCTPCEGTAYANATGGTAPYTYSWSTGDTTDFIDSLCAGNYIVTIIDDLGCVATDSVTINQTGTTMTLNMTATAASCPTCCDVCINPNLTGGCAPYSYSWLPSDPNWPPCSACPFETYTVTVTDNCGCTAVDSITTDTISTVGMENITLKNSIIDIYPNPSSEFLIIEVTNYSPTLIATVTDINGNILSTTKINRKSTIIKTSEFTPGVYLIHIQDGEKIIQTKKWIKQ